MKHSSIEPAASIHAKWCSCRRCSPAAPGAGYKAGLRDLAYGAAAGLLVGTLMLAQVL